MDRSKTIAQIEAEDMAEEPYNAAEPEQVNEARKKAGRRKSKRLEVIALLMQHQDGRAWIYELLEDCQMFGNPIVQGDTHATYANIGAANFGKKIWQDIEQAAPDECSLMLKEART